MGQKYLMVGKSRIIIINYYIYKVYYIYNIGLILVANKKITVVGQQLFFYTH